MQVRQGAAKVGGATTSRRGRLDLRPL